MAGTDESRDWLPDYDRILAGKGWFLHDFCNLQDSRFMTGKQLLADLAVERLFTRYYDQYPKLRDLYPNFDASRARLTHFAPEEIAELVEQSRSYVWLSIGTSISGCLVAYPRNRKVVEKLGYVAVAGGSAFNCGYAGVGLYKIVPGSPNPLEHQIAKFYAGGVYENRGELERLRADGLDL